MAEPLILTPTLEFIEAGGLTQLCPLCERPLLDHGMQATADLRVELTCPQKGAWTNE